MSYLGSKGQEGAWKAIVGIMPPHQKYIETHLGGGAVMRHKAPAAENIGLDLDGNVLSNFRCNYPVQLIERDALAWLKEQTWVGNECVYVDPPYLLSTRTSEKRYRCEYSEQDHIDLLGELKKSHPRSFSAATRRHCTMIYCQTGAPCNFNP